ncbi:MAG: hypothetical protein ACTSPM_00215 [Candidatus Heimdallarchaeota archaeon]
MNTKKITTLRDLLEELSKFDEDNKEKRAQIIESFSFKDNLETLNESELSIEEISELLEPIMIADNDIANDLLDILGIEYFAEKVNTSDSVTQVAKLIDQIEYISYEIGKELREKLDDTILASKINNSEDISGISFLLEIIVELSIERGKKILEKIPDKKILSLLDEKSALDKLALLSRIEMISNERLAKIMEKIHETFIQELLAATTVYEFSSTFWVLEYCSTKHTEKALEKVPLQKIVDLAEAKMDIESLVGIIEIMAKVSLDKTFDLLDALEPLILKQAKLADEPGDITDVLEVLIDLSTERAKELLDKMSIKDIGARIPQGAHTNTLRGIAWIIEIVHQISPERAIELVKVLKIENLKEMLEKGKKNHLACFNLIQAINKTSQKDAEFLISDISIDYMKKMIETTYEIGWFLKLVREVSLKKVKEIVIDNERVQEAFLSGTVTESIATFQEVAEIYEDKGLEFLQDISKDDFHAFIKCEIEDALTFERNFEKEGEVERIIAELKELADLAKQVSEEKKLEIKALIVEVVKEKQEEKQLSAERTKAIKWL